jgi:hypothetical protein
VIEVWGKSVGLVSYGVKVGGVRVRREVRIVVGEDSVYGGRG